MTGVLLVDCTAPLRKLLSKGIEQVAVHDSVQPASAPFEPGVVVVGPQSERPILRVQQVASAYPDAELIVAAAPSTYESLAAQLRIAPFVPLATQLVDAEAHPAARQALEETLRTCARRHRNRDAIARAQSELVRSHGRDSATLPATDLARPEDSPLSHSHQFDRQQLRQLLLTSVFYNSADAILTKTPDGIITAWNAAAERLYGYSASEVIGENVSMIVPQERRAELETIHRRLRAGERIEQLETVRVNKAGRRVDVSLSVSPVFSADGEIIGSSAIARDIGDRKRAERELRLRDARREAMLQGALDAIITIDHRGRVVELNPAAVELFGYGGAEAEGRPLGELILPAAAQDEFFTEVVGSLANGDRTFNGRHELTTLDRNGCERTVEVNIVRLVGTDPPFFTWFFHDITPLKQAEAKLKELVADLERSNRELEEFAYVASHDLQEPLRMVASYTDLLSRRYRGRLDEQADRYIEFASDGSRRMQQLIKDLLTLSRVGRHGQPFAPIPLADVVQEVQQVLAGQITETDAGVSVGPLPTLLGDRTQLVQLMQNLLGNALKFRAERPPFVRVEAEHSGGEWLVSIHDNGIGFADKDAERIFQMFQRLHARDAYSGSGIGLALVKKIVERHGGRVWAKGKNEHGGASFFLAFPAPAVLE